MITNEIDKFRADFFDKLIQEEKAKERQLVLKQKNCFHNYNIRGRISDRGYQHRTCSKCGHSAIKAVKVWEGTKNGCIIS